MLDASFLNNLTRLRLAMLHKSSMNLSGNRKSVQKGSSTEFSDFREYMPGDDIRRIDWNAYGRLDKLYIREYMEEKEAIVRILIDTSASMNYGHNSKMELAQKLAASFAFMALNHMDRVQIVDLQHINNPFQASGGKTSLPAMLEWINQLCFTGTVDLYDTISKLPAKESGITIIISDFLQETFLDKDNPSLSKLLRFLSYKKQKTILLHILAAQELRIELTGTYRLIDMETTDSLRVTMENKSLQTYEKTLKFFIEFLEKEATYAGASYALCDTDVDFYQLLFQKLRFAYDI